MSSSNTIPNTICWVCTVFDAVLIGKIFPTVFAPDTVFKQGEAVVSEKRNKEKQFFDKQISGGSRGWITQPLSIDPAAVLHLITKHL